jgi:hypothetical protein
MCQLPKDLDEGLGYDADGSLLTNSIDHAGLKDGLYINGRLCFKFKTRPLKSYDAKNLLESYFNFEIRLLENVG